jgi:two-component system, NarL family, sensor histidine kinase UhpB
MNKSRILVVEDEGLVAEDIRKHLEDLGYSVSSIASTGPEALKRVEKEKPDLVVMDIVLQDGQNGIKIARRIRARFDIPIVFMTAYSNEEIVNEAKDTEPYGYLLKPIDSKELSPTIEIALYKHASERKLKERQDRLASFLDPATDAFCLLDSSFKILEVNKTGMDNWGFKKEDILGKSLLSFALRGERKDWHERFRQVMRTGKPFRANDLAVPPRFGERFVNIKAFKTGDSLGLIISEITEKKRIEQSLRESENRYRLLVENMNEGMTMIDENGVITYVNAKFLDMLGYKREEILGHPVLEVLDPVSLLIYKQQMASPGDIRREPYELVWIKKAGQRMISLVSPSPICDDKNRFKGSAIVATDITERRRVEEELNRSREELRSLSRHLQSIRESESKRIAREIHDELGQALTAIKMDISWMSQKLPEAQREQERFLLKIDSMSKLIDMTIQTVQKISAELRPGLLDDLGLVPAIEWLGQDFQKRTGVKCILNLECDDSALGSECSTAIFRVIQEALTNVARHAQGSRVAISLKENKENLDLEIRDNGRGIRDEEIFAPESLGLIGIRERLHPFDGVFKLKGIPEKGTQFSISIPLKKAREK